MKAEKTTLGCATQKTFRDVQAFPATQAKC